MLRDGHKVPEVWLLICVVVLCDTENLTLTNQIAIFLTAQLQVWVRQFSKPILDNFKHLIVLRLVD